VTVDWQEIRLFNSAYGSNFQKLDAGFIGLIGREIKTSQNDIAVDPSRVLTALTGGKLSKFLF
jgi:hypothetical protein